MPFIDNLIQELQLELPGYEAHVKMAGRYVVPPNEIPITAKKSAVLCLIFGHSPDYKILLIERNINGSIHSGQIAFPGGKQDPEDHSLLETALRETQEEVGVEPSQIKILGALTPVYIVVSNYVAYPFVGYIEELPALKLSADEVMQVMTLSLSDLLNDQIKVIKSITVQQTLSIKAPAYDLRNGFYVWGATAMMLSELEEILKKSKNFYFKM